MKLQLLGQIIIIFLLLQMACQGIAIDLEREGVVAASVE